MVGEAWKGKENCWSEEKVETCEHGPSWRWPGSAACVQNAGVSRCTEGGYEKQPWRIEVTAVHGRRRS